jgi:hypothetical protein
MKRIITLAFSLLFVCTQLLGQGKLVYEKDSRWFWGLNIGTTWQTTDVKNQNDWGAGLMIGKSFNYNYGKKISFDLRGRYLYGNWYGQDVDTTGFQKTNAALSSGATNYKDGIGYSVLNYKTEVHRLALELVIHANGIRERSGWDPYIFGGVGFTWHETYGNQLDGNDTIFASQYAYDQLNGDFSKASLNAIQDRSYETALDGTTTGTFRVGFMPSLGFGLGYQVSPRFSLGLEHKTTFTRIDNFDGYVDASSKRPNDMYHYTSFYLRFQVKNRHNYVEDNPNSLHNLPNYENQTNQGSSQPPVVNFTNPSISGMTVSQPNFTIRAEVKFVDGKQNTTFRQNGINSQNFSYNATTDLLESNVVLVPGQNVFEITGVNAAGTDVESTIIIYNKVNEIAPPVVTFNNPPTSPFTITNPAFNLMATVLNVQQANQITMTVNGQSFQNFNFNPANNVVTANLNLTMGTNIVTVIGTNTAGTDVESTTLIYNVINEQLPIVNFTNPALSGTAVTQPNFNIRADVKFVNGKENITFRQNGIYNGVFTYNATTGRFESNVVLTPGQNVFEIVGTNTFGTDQETTIIVYNKTELLPPPVVTYTNPATSPYNTTSQTFPLTATVLNVQQGNQITMKVNGQTFTNFSFNPNNNSVSANLNLTFGSNIVVTTGTNAAGTDSKTTTIIYRPGVIEQPPVVYFVDPLLSPYTTMNSTFLLKAEVLNVAGSQNVTFKQNGSINQNFTFNSSTHDFQSSVVLTPGQNVFEIIGTNNAGTAQATTIIIYERQAPKPPIVTITNPSVNPYTTENSTLALSATVLNVTTANQITVTFNGQTMSNFTYVNANNSVSTFLNLVEGTNTVSVRGTNNDGTDIKQTIIIYRKPVILPPPLVTFTAPNVDPYTTEIATYTVSASVLNVANASGINVNVNGVNVTNFNFNPSSTALTFPVSLIEGANMIVITGTNTVGSDSKTHTIIYRKPQTIVPPIVTFQDPILNPLTVFNQTYNVKARVQYVAGPQNIQLKINGVTSTNFTYSNSSEVMAFTTSLIVGANIIEITATNTAGQDVKTTTIIFKMPDPMLPPTVTITNPVANPHASTIPSTPITATVLNVDGSQNIQVLINENAFNAFTYNTVTKQLTFTMSLNEGSNSLVITASNNAGQASDNRTINYRKLVIQNPPFVTFINPAVGGTTVSIASYAMKANVINVDNVSQIVVQQNGLTVNPSAYSFDASTKEVLFNTNLTVGNNAFTVTATNPAGTHSASTTIIYTIPVVACDKPTISFIAPATQSLEVEVNTFALSALIDNISGVNQVQVFVNGVVQAIFGSYNTTTKVFSQNIGLSEGQNTIEIVATNSCGVEKKNRMMIFKPAAAPCLSPIVQRILPNIEAANTQETTVQIKASVINVASANEIVLKVNGVATAANYDLATKELSATVTLKMGINTIEVQVSNECGSARTSWMVTRNECKKPVIVLNSSTNANNSSTFAEAFGLNASITGLTQGSTITVTQNGKQINFVFNQQTSTLVLDRPLDMGANVFVITATNECGTTSMTITVTKTKDPNAVPPKINITNPATTPYNTEIGAMNIQVSTQFVTAASQVSITVNGVPTNFNFNASNGIITFNQTFVVGNNVIIATAVNNYGTATDTKTVIYKEKVIPAPVITITSPANCPATLAPGIVTITGFVTNINNLSEVTFTINGRPISNVNPVLSNGNLNFSFTVNLGEGSNGVNFQINAVNAGGSDSESCQIVAQAPCLAPTVKRVLPNIEVSNTQESSIQITANVNNVASANEITVKVNGNIVAANYNSATKELTASINLQLGLNSIEVIVGNKCGSAKTTWTVTRKECTKPVIVINSSTTPNNSTTFAQAFGLNATVNGLSQGSNVTITQNGKPVNFAFNQQNSTLTLDRPLDMGNNVFVITATNACGSVTMTFNVTKATDPNAVPPKINITNPATTPFNTDNSSMNIQVNTQFVNAANQVSITVNGAAVNFNYNASNGVITFNQNFVAGNNVIVATATNQYGTDSDTKTVIYKVKVIPAPVITITAPASCPATLAPGIVTITGFVTNINNLSEVTFTINGRPLTNVNPVLSNGNLNFSFTVNLGAGNNGLNLQINAANAGGSDAESCQITALAPCLAPTVQRVLPNIEANNTQEASIQIAANVNNVANANEIIVKVNGNMIAANYNSATKELTASVNLQMGMNSIEVIASNNCGTAKTTWSVTRKECTKPVIVINSSTAPNNSSTFAQAFGLNATVNGLSQGSNVTITQNGQPVNFAFNQQNSTLTLDRPLSMGNNVFAITATNACGSVTMTFSVTKTTNPNAVPPKINITNPATSPYNTDNGSMNIQVNTQFVTAANQVSITVNGVAVNFNYNASNGVITFNQNFVNGNNVIVANASNGYGTASDTKTVVYKKQIIPVPQIFITSPKTCPAKFSPGAITVTGYVTNIGNVNEVTFKANGNIIPNVNLVLNNGTLSFSFTINIGDGNNLINLLINATNVGGSDSKTCEFSLEPVGRPGTPNPNINPNIKPKTPTPTPTPTPTIRPVIRP